MKNLESLLFLGALVGFQVELSADDLVIERQVPQADSVASSSEDWEKVGDGLFRAEFWVPADIVSHGPTQPVDDPFSSEGEATRRVGVKRILEELGIDFPEGASAMFDARAPKLTVVNTWPNLELVQAYATGLDWPPPSKRVVAVRTEIYEVTTLQALQLLESATAEGNHEPERNAALRAVREGSAKLIATHSLVTTPGQRAKVEDTTEIRTPESKEGDKKTGGEPREVLVAREYGTILEVEPNIDADEFTLSLNLAIEHHTAEPELISVAGRSELPKFHANSHQTNVAIAEGDYLLIGTWKPTGKPEHAEHDLTQVLFVHASIQTASARGE